MAHQIICESGTRFVSVGSKNGIHHHQRCRTTFTLDARAKSGFAQEDEGKFLAKEKLLSVLAFRADGVANLRVRWRGGNLPLMVYEQKTNSLRLVYPASGVLGTLGEK